MPPLDQGCNLNTNDALKARTNMVIVGGLIRDNNGGWVKGFIINIGPIIS